MEIIKLTNERIKKILPQHIQESDVISKNAKKVLATIMNYYLVLDKVKEQGYVFLTNETLRQSLGIKRDNMLTAIRELIETNLIERESGKKRTKGEKSTASRYRVLWNNLQKPLKEKTYEELFSNFLNTSKDKVGTVVVDVVPDIETEIDIETETVSDRVLEIEKEIETDKNKTTTNSYTLPSTYKDLEYFFLEKIREKCKNKTLSVEELNEIQESLKDELNEFKNIEDYENIFKFVIQPSIRKEKKKLLLTVEDPYEEDSELKEACVSTLF